MGDDNGGSKGKKDATVRENYQGHYTIQKRGERMNKVTIDELNQQHPSSPARRPPPPNIHNCKTRHVVK